VIEAHGDRRVDDWYWLGDREDPQVLEHLRAENAYAEAVLATTGSLRERLFEEIRARIAETDLSVPVRHGPYWYYSRTIEGAAYPISCRCPAAGDEPPEGPGPHPGEEVLLDQNQLAEGEAFCQVANLAVSPDHRRLAFGVDTTGAERYQLRFRDLGGGSGPAEVVADTYYGLAWANDGATVFYTRVDEAMRPYQLWRHRLGQDPAEDELVLEEPDERFTLGVGRTKDDQVILVVLSSTTTSEWWWLPADRPEAEPQLVEGRRPGHEYSVDHYPGPAGHDGWWLVVTNDSAEDFRLMAAPVAGGPGLAGRWREVLAHRPGTRLDQVDVAAGRLVAAERLDAEARLRVVPLGSGDDPFAGDLMAGSWLVPATEHPSTTWEGPNPEFGSAALRIEQTSLVTPRTVSDVDLTTGAVTVRKRQPVLGDFDPARYRTARLWVPAPDGAEVPVSVVHRVELLADPADPPGSPLAGPAPCLLYGYGAYEASIDPAFSSLRLSLLDRGFVFAIAHVRGGGERGRRWYEEGKMEHKGHSFSDFVACARHLVATGFTAPDRLVARGGSAGGLLMGASMNLAPELFRAVVAEVPFVDVLTTMLDETLPLTVGEWEEWGNPAADPTIYRIMKAYSPYDNVASTGPDGRPVRYPELLATAGLNDNRVGYWEPTKWVARLRAANPANRALLRVELEAGHGGPSGRYDAWREEAQALAFILGAVGLADEPPWGGAAPA
jgi:oligopeptidase B